jgi:hydroxyethylthiazole kinase
VEGISGLLEAVRKKAPLVHQITNYVTVNDCANATICAGGSPVMTDEIGDAPAMTGFASALVLNIGTANARVVDTMIACGKAANDAGAIVVLDPVGVGATEFRTSAVDLILKKVEVGVIKGNAGEISIMAGEAGKVRGVDSAGGSGATAAEALAKMTGTVVGMSGPVDYVSDGNKTYILSNGHETMGRISGTGCMLSSVTGCYVGTKGASVDAVAAAISAFGIAGEIAGRDAGGPGTFKPLLFDALYNMDGKAADRMRKIKPCTTSM